MKKLNFNSLNYILAFLVLGFSISCTKEGNLLTADSMPPGQVSEISITPTHGGVEIYYTLPDDDDISYVKASYINTLGQEMFSVCSAFDNKIVIEGLNDVSEHTAYLEVIDRAENKSEKLPVKFTPLKSHIELVRENLEMEATFGGVSIKWENQEKKTVYVHVSYLDTANNEITRFFSSANPTERFMIRGLNTEPRAFSIQVEDFYGNKTAIESKGEFTPMHEVKINKSLWTLVEALSINGNAWEGRTENVFDDVIDYVETDDDNSYAIITRDNNGGQLNYPLDIVINMNQEVVMNRIQVWQRAFWYNGDGKPFYYQSENFKAFDLYISNDLKTWIQVGSFDIGDPKDENGVAPDAAIKEAEEGHDFILDGPTEPFKYLKFSITENYGSEEQVNISEISLFGI